VHNLYLSTYFVFAFEFKFKLRDLLTNVYEIIQKMSNKIAKKQETLTGHLSVLKRVIILHNHFFFLIETKFLLKSKQTLYNPTTRETKPYKEDDKSDIRHS
jgi:hypothetical protein